MRRMDRYDTENTIKTTRSNKNKDLYQNITNRYTNITDVTNVNVYELDNNKEERTSREKYQQLRKYQSVEQVPRVKKELEDFNYLYPKKERKVYDINSVLEEARKNKLENDKLEEKRKLKHTSYNILAGMNLEELIKYREEKKNREMTEEEQEIRELVDTIASKTLAGEIDKATTVDLLSDLMATNMLDKVSASKDLDKEENSEEEISDSEKELLDSMSLSKNQLSDKLEEMEAISDDTDNQIKKVDTDFYTRSMDLSEEDFEMDQEFAEKGLPTSIKVLIMILLLVIVAVAAYFIYQKI